MDEEGHCRGVTAWKLDDGTMHRFQGADDDPGDGRVRTRLFVVHLGLATSATAAGMVLRAGLPLQDM